MCHSYVKGTSIDFRMNTVIHATYVEHQEAILAFLKGTPLQLPGDGRCDSPGYSAKYCTYSLMDNAYHRLQFSADVRDR